MSPCHASERPVQDWVPGPEPAEGHWDSGGGTGSTISSGLSLSFSCCVFHSCIFFFCGSVGSMYGKCFTLLVVLRNKDCWKSNAMEDKAAPKRQWPERVSPCLTPEGPDWHGMAIWLHCASQKLVAVLKSSHTPPTTWLPLWIYPNIISQPWRTSSLFTSHLKGLWVLRTEK